MPEYKKVNEAIAGATISKPRKINADGIINTFDTGTQLSILKPLEEQ